MIIENYNTKELNFVGFWDRCLFKHNDDSGGYVFEDKQGKKVYFTHRQIKKALKTEEQKQ